jgi:hypothetical protein
MDDTPPPPNAAPGKTISDAARRALAEAAERRTAEQVAFQISLERGGPAGPEPTRFGDWEHKGVAVDF